jgi:hypothetical protein
MTGNIELLDNECGIFIAADNLSDIELKGATTTGTNNMFTSGSLDTYPINYWTSILDDKLNSRAWGDSPAWKTRVRLTATIMMDHRIEHAHTISGSGCSLTQAAVFDWNRSALFRSQTNSSIFKGVSGYTADTVNDTTALQASQTAVDAMNKVPNYAGNFEFAAIYPHRGGGGWLMPFFMVGDCVTGMDGRNISFALGGNRHIYIEQVTYLPEINHTSIVLSDLRKAKNV